MTAFDAIVIGAGPNGLVAAGVLATRGKRVLVLESAESIGGHTRTIEFAPGCRAPLNEDCGWVPANVASALGLGSPDVPTVNRPTTMSVPHDGKLVTLPASFRKMAELLSAYSQRDAQRWPAFSERFEKFADVLARLYQMAPPDIDTTSPGDILSLVGVGLQVRRMGRADMTEFLRVMPMSVQDLVDDEFETEWLKAAIASAAIRDLRQGPRSGGTTYNLLHYMVGAAHGSFRARQWFLSGPDAFAVAAADKARALGVEIRIGARVDRIVVRDGAAAGVVVGSEEISAPMVISTADPKRTLLELVEPQWLDPEIGLAVSNVKLRGCTAFVLYAADIAIKEDDKHAMASAVSLTADTTALEQAADAAKYGEISVAPHVEFFVPTLRWPSLAPAGRHVVVARVQYAPYALKSGAWSKADAATVEKKTTSAIGAVLPSFANSVTHATVLTPRDVEEKFGVTEGALTHGELMLDQIMFMRPVPGWGRYVMPVRGLFLGGAGAHPGPGVLGGAGYLAARAIRA